MRVALPRMSLGGIAIARDLGRCDRFRVQDIHEARVELVHVLLPSACESPCARSNCHLENTKIQHTMVLSPRLLAQVQESSHQPGASKSCRPNESGEGLQIRGKTTEGYKNADNRCDVASIPEIPEALVPLARPKELRDLALMRVGEGYLAVHLRSASLSLSQLAQPP